MMDRNVLFPKAERARSASLLSSRKLGNDFKGRPQSQISSYLTYVRTHLITLSCLYVRRTQMVVRAAHSITKEPNTLVFRFRESRYLEEKRGVDTPWSDLLESMKEMSTILQAFPNVVDLSGLCLSSICSF